MTNWTASRLQVFLVCRFDDWEVRELRIERSKTRSPLLNIVGLVTCPPDPFIRAHDSFQESDPKVSAGMGCGAGVGV